MNATCEGCGSELADGGVDMFCPNNDCDYEMKQARKVLQRIREARERAEYERLKAKYEGTKE